MRPKAKSLRPFWTQRRYYLPLLISALANAVIYPALTYRLATKQERLAGAWASLTESVAAAQRELQDLQLETDRITRNEEAARRFFSEVVETRDPGLTEAIAELDQMAEESGIKRGATSFHYEELDVGLVQANASMPLVGSYFNLVGFINRLERSPRFFLVQAIGLKGMASQGTEVELHCDVSFLLKDNRESGESGS